MDNALTPKRIERLINLAEGRPFNIERLLLTDEQMKILTGQSAMQTGVKSPAARGETSSGIIDLEQVQAFGESGSNLNISMSKSTAFNPGEITGRSTEDTSSRIGLESYGHHSIAIDSITSQMDKQTNEIQEIMRHSIASNYSFHSKRDLTADEASLVARGAPLPVMQNTQTYFDTASISSQSNLSVGTYFRKRCDDFGKILGKTDSPDHSYMMPSITEVSDIQSDHGKSTDLIKIDDTLDSVPVRQPRSTELVQKSHTKQMENTQDHAFKKPEKPKNNMSMKVQEKPQHIRSLNPSAIPHKSFPSSKPTDVLLKNLQASFMPAPDDTSETVENSISLSKIADYLGKQSDVSVTDIMKLQKKQPLTELNMNTPKIPEINVTQLLDSKKTETASSAGTVQTVISLNKLNIHDKESKGSELSVPGSHGERKRTRSKSPTSRSPSTMSTVRDNYSNNSSLKSGDSPDASNNNEVANRSKIPSPNIVYRELDKSVDWQAVLQQKNLRQRGVAKEKWVEIIATPVTGFIGVTTSVSISVRTLTDSWLKAKFRFEALPNDGKDINLELPRLPLLLSPGKSEDFTFHITCNAELETVLPFSVYVQDASIDADLEEKGELHINFKVPVIQAMSSDGLNKLTYPPVTEKTAITKTFIIISDCSADLQLKLSITEGDSMFSIKNIHQIKKSDVNKALLERQLSEDSVKSKSKPINKQLCRLDKDGAIKVSVTFNSPALDMNLFTDCTMIPFNGGLLVTLIGSNTVLKKVDLIGLMGIPKLQVDTYKCHVKNEPETISVCNRGSVAGTWSARYRHSGGAGEVPFEFNPARFGLAAGASLPVQVFYKGKPEDGLVELPIRFEELTTGESSEVMLIGGTERPKSFPIKSSAISLSWVRPGHKEISLKNISDRKVYIRCQIVGEGFSIDMPGGDSKGMYLLCFNALEVRPLPILFAPGSCVPHAATLVMVQERTHNGLCRKIKLYGCASGAPVRWWGLVTYLESAALVRASGRGPVDLTLHNKADMPAFVAATVHFNIQYMCMEPYFRLVGARAVVGARSRHTVSLQADWGRVGAVAGAPLLATITVLTGAETTRHRILRIVKNKSQGQMDVSLLPEHLRMLAGEFDNADPNIEPMFAAFHETEESLNELIQSGVQELTAHVDLPRDFEEDNTTLVADDTVMHHHTMFE